MYLKPTGVTNTFDVFLHEGWSNWSRVEVKDDGTIVVVKGLPLNSHFLSHIKNMISSIFYSDLRAKRRK